ncbi:acyl-CoA carboxylase epsilon subunit [Nonomuraea sp. B12E4]|uniref:acyl-CoA carboxylase epsilon subunit n=1 Tax=Nonomuraea sp. B12E4 TaxID=3153564 RepID=UPI00325CB3FA
MALLTVERGAPTAEELAALTAVVAARLQARSRLQSRARLARPGRPQGGRRLAPWVVRAGLTPPRPAPGA